ncbi:MAG: luciferase [Oligoflexus sp.]
MKFDIFLSICQTDVDGYMPDERTMFHNFFDQLRLADELGFGVAWIAESHLSCEIQKQNPNPVIPHFKGEIGLNTDILQLAHKAFHMTDRIEIGSAIRNILCNGGPLAHAEAVKTFLSLHGLDPNETRKLYLGYAAGRFPFSNHPYGIKARNALEELAWPVLKGLIFRQAIEIFNRALRNETISSDMISPMYLQASQFKGEELWHKIRTQNQETGYAERDGKIEVPSYWSFEKVGVIPFEGRMDLLQLVLGSHDPIAQELANKYLPHWVFNLSITPSTVIEETHERLSQCFHPAGGNWQRSNMPRTVLIFVNGEENLSPSEQRQAAQQAAEKAVSNYWRAVEGTLDPRKVAEAVENAVSGNPQDVAEQLMNKYDPNDRLMLWFDFNNHNNDEVKASMKSFWQQVRPLLSSDKGWQHA